MCRCKGVGIDNISYEITIGNSVNEIILLSEEMNFDIIIIMTASRITSFVRILANIVRKTIKIRKPPALVH